MEHKEEDLSTNAWMEGCFILAGNYPFPRYKEGRILEATFLNLLNFLPLSYAYNRSLRNHLEGKRYGDVNAYEAMKSVHREADSIHEFCLLINMPNGNELLKR